jgi:hypothetical protein
MTRFFHVLELGSPARAAGLAVEQRTPSSRRGSRVAAPARPDFEPSTRVAYHEAGHVVTAWILGGAIRGPVSIEPTAHWDGVAFVAAPGGYTRAELLRAQALPVVLWPARIRRVYEGSVMICLAGAIAESYAPHHVEAVAEVPAYPGCVSCPADEPFAATVRDTKLLARGEAQEAPFGNDVAQAFTAAEKMCAAKGEFAAARLVEFLHCETVALLEGDLAQHLLSPLAAALLERRTLSARGTRELLVSLERQAEGLIAARRVETGRARVRAARGPRP